MILRFFTVFKGIWGEGLAFFFRSVDNKEYMILFYNAGILQWKQKPSEEKTCGKL